MAALIDALAPWIAGGIVVGRAGVALAHDARDWHISRGAAFQGVNVFSGVQTTVARAVPAGKR